MEYITNLLPQDGTALYYGAIMPPTEADAFLAALMTNIAWQPDEGIMWGKRYVTRRKTAWYADAPFTYTYARIPRQALAWTAELREIKKLTEQASGCTFNSCLLNLYHNGSEGMGWHSDNERMLLKEGAIASISLGAVRTFSFRHKTTQQTVSLMLQHGSLLLMKGAVQSHWLHCLPKSKEALSARINLTFRTIAG